MQRILITGANRGIGFELARTNGLMSRKTPSHCLCMTGGAHFLRLMEAWTQ